MDMKCCFNMCSLFHILYRWTFLRPRRRTARTKSARSTHSTRWLSIRRARIACLPRESAVMTASSQDMVVRPSLSSTRRPRPPRRLFWSCSARAASTTHSTQLRGASILRLVETRRAREHLSSKFLIAHLDVGSNLWVYYCSKNSSNFNVTSSSESRSCCVSNSNAWHLRWVWVVFWLNEVLHPESSLNVLCVCLILFCDCLSLKLDHTEDGLCNVTGWMESHSSLTELLEMILHMK